MIAGNCRVNLDAPPYFTFSGFDIEAKGLNLVGLRRAGFKVDEIAAIKQAYKLLYRSGLKRAEALARIEQEIDSEHARRIVRFVRSSKRGVCSDRGRSAAGVD